MPTWGIVVLVIVAVLAIILGVLIFLGKKAQKKQENSPFHHILPLVFSAVHNADTHDKHQSRRNHGASDYGVKEIGKSMG